MLTERTLAHDARERAVIAKAMLAVESKKIATPEQRVFMWQALTRPSAVTAADDTAPMNLLDTMISKASQQRP